MSFRKENQPTVSTKDLVRSPKNPNGQECSASPWEKKPVSAEDGNRNMAGAEYEVNDQKLEAQDLVESGDGCMPDDNSPFPVSKPSNSLIR